MFLRGSWRVRTTIVQTRSLQLERLRNFATRRRDADLDEDDVNAARQWLAKLDADTIPREVGEVTFSRSSGPGGQNVNKVSSKATLRVPLKDLLPQLPVILHPAVRNSRYVAARSDELVIQADEARKQGENVAACYRKLHEVLVSAGREAVPGETSLEQSRRVDRLQKAEAAGRRRLKDHLSQKKKARRSGGDD